MEIIGSYGWESRPAHEGHGTFFEELALEVWEGRLANGTELWTNIRIAVFARTHTYYIQCINVYYIYRSKKMKGKCQKYYIP